MTSPATLLETSEVEWLASLPEADRTALLKGLPDDVAAELAYDWSFWSRPAQRAPAGDWSIWLVMAGRGFGKTRTGAEWVREQVAAGSRRVAIVGATRGDVRDICVEGDSGILAICPPWDMPKWEPTKRRLTWPNGARATVFSADKPDRLRGPQYDAAWADELAAWRHMAAWDNLLFGLRLGENPRVVVTTTPRPIPAIKGLLSDATCTVTKGTTYDNLKNLAPTFAARIIKRYEGTRLGAQELNALILDDTPGALWTRALIEASRITAKAFLERVKIVRVVVAIDPSVGDPAKSEDIDEAGIVVCGLGADGHGYVLEDRSLLASPDGWARAAVGAYHKHRADRIVAEVNNGGAMVELTVRTVDPNVSYKELHASRGKQPRAEPIAALYEQGRAHHVGMFAKLEDEMADWVPGMKSPNRMDALVWAFTELMLDGRAPGDLGISLGVGPPAQQQGPKPFAEQNADAFLGRNGHSNGRGNGFS